VTRLIIATFTAILLTGCALSTPATSRQTPAQTSVSTTGSGEPLPAATDSGPSVGNATTALLQQSRTERADGDLSRAAATIERALSISPDDALLWVELAEIRMDQGDGVLAAEMARKALTLTPADSPVAARAGRIIRR
jgi:Flp pilus assembly protein TadD